MERNLKRKLHALLIMLCIVLKVSAHSLHISGTLNGTIPPDFELYVAPLTDGEQSVKAIVSGTTFSADVAADGNGLYSLTAYEMAVS